MHFYACDTAHVHIGSFCSLTMDVEFLPGGNHRLDWVSTFLFRVQFNPPGTLEDAAAKRSRPSSMDVAASQRPTELLAFQRLQTKLVMAFLQDGST